VQKFHKFNKFNKKQGAWNIVLTLIPFQDDGKA
jgi:hypothetical protein